MVQRGEVKSSETTRGRFKRKALNFFGNSKLLTLDEMAGLLYKKKVVCSKEQGKEVAPSFDGRGFIYAQGLKVDKSCEIHRQGEFYRIDFKDTFYDK